MTVTTAGPSASTTRDPMPALAEGVELIGEYEGSGYKEPPSLVRRRDGQVIQLPPLLFSVAAMADGETSYAEIAQRVSAEIKRGIDGDQVRYLAENKLEPLGVLAGPAESAIEKADPFLGLRFRAAVVPEWLSNGLGLLFSPLFAAPVVVLVLGAFVAVDVWLFAVHGVAQAVRQAIYHPGLFLPLFGGIVVAAAFHEIGHAAACRKGGGRPGRMGCGLYLAWPAFYTDVTDAYRLGRRARLRTDLGGVYFNVVVVLMVTAAYAATRFEPLLLLAVIQHFEIAHQLLPVVRLDGYYIVADLTGVPDLFARIGPILRNLVPGRRVEEVQVLKRWVRVAVTTWVLVVVPALLAQLVILLVHLPRIAATAGSSTSRLGHHASASFSAGHYLPGVTDVLQVVVLAIPLLGIGLVVIRGAMRSARWTWHHTEGRPVRRVLAVAVAAAAIALLVQAWLPSHNYRPIGPHERGTVVEGVSSLRRVGSGPAHWYRPAAVISGNGAPAGSTATTTTLGSTDSSTTTMATTDSTVDTATTGTTVQSTSVPASSSTTSSSSTTTSEPATTSTTEASTTTSAP